MTKASPSPPSHTRNIRATSLALLSASVVSFLFTPYLLYQLQDTRFGIWALLNTIFGVSGLIDLGLRSSFEQRLARAWHRGKPHYINVTYATGRFITLKISSWIAITTSVAAASTLFANWIPEDVRFEVFLAIVAFGLELSLTFRFFSYAALMSVMRRFDIIGNLSLFDVIGTTTTTLVCVTFTNNIGILAIAFVTPRIISKLFMRSIATSKFNCKVTPVTSSRLTKIFLQRGFLKFAASASYKVIGQIDTLTVFATCSIASVAPYSLGASLAARLKQVQDCYKQSLNGELLRLVSKKQEAELRELVFSATRYALLIILPLATVSMLYAESFFELWISDSPAVLASKPSTIYCILAFYAATVVCTTPMTDAAVAYEKHAAIAKFCAFEAAVNLLLSIVLGLRFGMCGVAYATIIACFLVHVPSRILLASHVLSVPFTTILHKSCMKPAACLLAFTPALVITKNTLPDSQWGHLIIAGIVTQLIWLTLALSLGLKEHERKMLLVKAVSFSWK